VTAVLAPSGLRSSAPHGPCDKPRGFGGRGDCGLALTVWKSTGVRRFSEGATDICCPSEACLVNECARTCGAMYSPLHALPLLSRIGKGEAVRVAGDLGRPPHEAHSAKTMGGIPFIFSSNSRLEPNGDAITSTCRAPRARRHPRCSRPSPSADCRVASAARRGSVLACWQAVGAVHVPE
jgi:hypothetical protein